MAELQLESLPPEGLPKNLVTQANPKNRQAACHQVANGLHRVAKSRWIARTIGQEDARRFIPQCVLGSGARRHYLDSEPVLPESTQDVVFHPVIVSDNRDVRRWERLARAPCFSGNGTVGQHETRAPLIFLVPHERFLVGPER